MQSKQIEDQGVYIKYTQDMAIIKAINTDQSFETKIVIAGNNTLEVKS